MADETQERADGPTPNGGTYSIAYYSDGRGNRVPKAEAAAVEVVEFDASGRALRRTYARLKPDRPDAAQDE